MTSVEIDNAIEAMMMNADRWAFQWAAILVCGIVAGDASPHAAGVHVGARNAHRVNEIGYARIVGRYHVTRWAPLETVQRFGL